MWNCYSNVIHCFGKMPVHTTTDLGAIWQEAVDQYEDATKVTIASLPPISNLNMVLNEIRTRETAFRSHRHNGSRLDKFRSLVSKSSKPIEVIGSMIASSASTVRGNLIFIDRIISHDQFTGVPSKHHDLHGRDLPHKG